MATLIDAAALQGKHTALRIAKEETLHHREVWTSEHVRRFRYEPDQPDFTSRTLMVLIEHALIGHMRRVEKALGEAATARRHAAQAELAAWQRTEEALGSFRDPIAEHLTRQAVRAHTFRAYKETSKLRLAMESLENEAAWAQSSHVAAMRVIATRLTAQHDASVNTALTELEAAEEQTAATKQARTHMRTCTHAWCARAHPRAHTDTQARTYGHMRACTQTRAHAQSHMHTYTCRHAQALLVRSATHTHMHARAQALLVHHATRTHMHARAQALLVHHEAVLSVLQTELEFAETSGHYCIRTLEDELGRTRQAHAAQVQLSTYLAHACVHACSHACVLACLHACMLACLHACMLACVHAAQVAEMRAARVAEVSAYLLTYLRTYLRTCLLTYLLTYVLAYFLTCLLT